jgi:Domain of unknown function (DUF4234)
MEGGSQGLPEQWQGSAGPPAPPTQPPVAERGLETFPLLDRESRRRRETDTQLSYAMYLVVGFITFGIYIIYVHFKLIQRQQEHFKRMGRFNDDLLKLVEERASDTGQTAAAGSSIDELRQLNEDYQRLQRGKERSPALWIILSIITLGLAFLYVLWFLNADLVAHQRAEAEYIEKASGVLNRLGIGKHPVVVEQVVPDRSFPLYLFLTIITIGLFEFYWAYVRINDGNQHFLEHDRFEDQLMAVIRTAA